MSSTKANIRRLYQMFFITFERQKAWCEIEAFMPVLEGALLQLECIGRSLEKNSCATGDDVARFIVTMEALREQGLSDVIDSTSKAIGSDISQVRADLFLLLETAIDLNRIVETSFQQSACFVEEVAKTAARRIERVRSLLLQANAVMN